MKKDLNNEPLSNKKEEQSPQMFIDANATVNMEVSAWFHDRMGAMVEWIISENATKDDGTLDVDLILNVNEQIKSNNIETEWGKHYYTCLVMLEEFENLAKRDKLLTATPSATFN